MPKSAVMVSGRQPQRRVLACLFRFDFRRDGALQPLQLYPELVGHFGSSSFLVLLYAFERAGAGGGHSKCDGSIRFCHSVAD